MLRTVSLVLVFLVIGVFAWIVYGPEYAGPMQADTISNQRENSQAAAETDLAQLSGKNKTDATVNHKSINQAAPGAVNTKPIILHSELDTDVKSQTLEEALLDIATARVVVDDYIVAWRSKDVERMKEIWLKIVACDPCMLELRDLLMNGGLEKGLVLELSNAIIATGNEIMMPVFDYLLNPVNDRSTSIIVSEQLIRDGRARYVQKVFDAIQAAEADGMQQFSYQLSWVISKLKNVDGLGPVLDIIASKNQYTPEYSAHVANILSKTMRSFDDQEALARKVSDYFSQATPQEQEYLWEVVKSQSDSLVMLASQAHINGENYNVEKFTSAIAEMQNKTAVDSIMALTERIDYPQEYFVKLARKSISHKPDTDTLRRYEDYLRDPKQSQKKRVIAAEGLLAAKDKSKLASYILDKLMQYGGYEDADIQAYVSSRL